MDGAGSDGDPTSENVVLCCVVSLGGFHIVESVLILNTSQCQLSGEVYFQPTVAKGWRKTNDVTYLVSIFVNIVFLIRTGRD